MRDLSAAIRNQPPAEHRYDWDPLHTPGSIQPYGALLVADAQSRQVLFASENTADIFGMRATDVIDHSYLALCDNERERRLLKESIDADTILFPNPVRLTIKGKPFDAVFHAHNGEHLIEIEAADPDVASYHDMADRAVQELHDPGSVEELYRRAVQVVRDVTGFDRVMLYRFDARYNGQVLAESSREGIGSFLGLFFPSGDIGANARELYLKNFTRYIPDIGAGSVPLVGVHPGGGTADSAHPVDMTHANLRSVAPCHITYLTNIGVKASMSFSINVDDRLWGLFACHHYKPKRVSYDQRVVCEQAAMMFIFKLNSITSVAARLQQRARGVQQIGRALAVGAALTRRIGSLETAWGDAADQEAAKPMLENALAAIHAQTSWLLAGEGYGPQPSAEPTPQQKMLLDLVEADSAAVVRHGRIHRIGDAPPDMAIYAIAAMFGRELPDLGRGNLPVFATDNLSSIAPVAEEIKDRAAGVMAVSLADDAADYLLWFRREQIVHATWAGNPSDTAITGGAGTFNPRASFNAWKQDIRNLSRPWVIEDVEIAYDLGNLIRASAGAPRDAAFSRPAPVKWPAPPLAAQPAAPAYVAPPPRAAPAHQGAVQRRVIRVGQL
jgi:light-regulated signal transduction histidine kinase (bacteriophytochrome)